MASAAAAPVPWQHCCAAAAPAARAALQAQQAASASEEPPAAAVIGWRAACPPGGSVGLDIEWLMAQPLARPIAGASGGAGEVVSWQPVYSVSSRRQWEQLQRFLLPQLAMLRELAQRAVARAAATWPGAPLGGGLAAAVASALPPPGASGPLAGAPAGFGGRPDKAPRRVDFVHDWRYCRSSNKLLFLVRRHAEPQACAATGDGTGGSVRSSADFASCFGPGADAGPPPAARASAAPAGGAAGPCACSAESWAAACGAPSEDAWACDEWVEVPPGDLPTWLMVKTYLLRYLLLETGYLNSAAAALQAAAAAPLSALPSAAAAAAARAASVETIGEWQPGGAPAAAAAAAAAAARWGAPAPQPGQRPQQPPVLWPQRPPHPHVQPAPQPWAPEQRWAMAPPRPQQGPWWVQHSQQQLQQQQQALGAAALGAAPPAQHRASFVAFGGGDWQPENSLSSSVSEQDMEE